MARRAKAESSDDALPSFVTCDDGRRELRLGDAVVKVFSKKAPDQEYLLTVFQEQGWPKLILDPLSPKTGRNPKVRLHDAVNHLNQRQSTRLLRFHCDGSGQALYWEVVKTIGTTSAPHRHHIGTTSAPHRHHIGTSEVIDSANLECSMGATVPNRVALGLLVGMIAMRRTLLSAFILGCSVAAAWWIAFGGSQDTSPPPTPKTAPPRPPGVPGLSVAASAQNFGVVWEEKDFVWQLPIRNNTAADIKIDSFAASCACLDVEPSKMTIPAGETLPLRLKINLGVRAPGQAESPVRQFTLHIQPRIAGQSPKHKGYWQLDGTVKSRITVSRQQVEFGEVPLAESPASARQTVAATMHLAESALEAELDPKIGTVKVAGAKAANKSRELVIALNPEVPAGPFKGKVLTFAKSTAGEKLPGPEIAFSGTILSDIRAVPAKLLLPPGAKMSTVTGTVALQMPATVVATVQRIETSSPGIVVVPLPREGSQAANVFSIAWTLDTEGQQSGQVRFVLRRADGSISVVPVDVIGYGQKTTPSQAIQIGGLP